MSGDPRFPHTGIAQQPNYTVQDETGVLGCAAAPVSRTLSIRSTPTIKRTTFCRRVCRGHAGRHQLDDAEGEATDGKVAVPLIGRLESRRGSGFRNHDDLLEWSGVGGVGQQPPHDHRSATGGDSNNNGYDHISGHLGESVSMTMWLCKRQ